MNAAAWILCALFSIGGVLAIVAGATGAPWLLGCFPGRYRSAMRVFYVAMGCAILAMMIVIASGLPAK